MEPRAWQNFPRHSMGSHLPAAGPGALCQRLEVEVGQAAVDLGERNRVVACGRAIRDHAGHGVEGAVGGGEGGRQGGAGKGSGERGGKRVAQCNAFSGTYVLNYIRSESERRKMRMEEVNKLFLDSCLLGLLRHMSPDTKVRASTKSFITKKDLKPYVRERLKDMRQRNIPVHRFESLKACESYKPAVQLARINAWKKSQDRRIETMRRFASPEKVAEMKEKVEKQYESKKAMIVEVPEWQGF